MNRSTRRLPCHHLLNLKWSFEFSNPEEEEENSTIEGSKQAGQEVAMVALTQAKVTWWATQGFMRLECHGCSSGTAHVRRSSQVRSHVTVCERGQNTQAQTLSSEKRWKRLNPKKSSLRDADTCEHTFTTIVYIHLPRADSNSRRDSWTCRRRWGGEGIKELGGHQTLVLLLLRTQPKLEFL